MHMLYVGVCIHMSVCICVYIYIYIGIIHTPICYHCIIYIYIYIYIHTIHTSGSSQNIVRYGFKVDLMLNTLTNRTTIPYK